MASTLETPFTSTFAPAAEAVESNQHAHRTVAVVGQPYCMPYPLELVITQKLNSPTHGDYLITDANGTVVFSVKGVLCSLRGRRILYDAADRPVLTMQKKILSLRRRWEVFKGDHAAEYRQVRLFSMKQSSLLQFHTELDVFLDSNFREDARDFSIVGDFFQRSCGVYVGRSNTLIAQMHKKMNIIDSVLGKDTFGVTVYPNVDFAFIVALVVVLDGMNTDRAEARRHRHQRYGC